MGKLNQSRPSHECPKLPFIFMFKKYSKSGVVLPMISADKENMGIQRFSGKIMAG
jgi:hypothetical protein